MNYSEIKYCDSANSTGVRTTLFVSGCKRHWPFCFNEVAWKFSASKPFTKDIEDTIIESIEPFYVDGLSTLGDEPMEPENQRGLVDFPEHVKKIYPEKPIWLYSDFTYEELAGTEPVHVPYTGSPRCEITDRILQTLSILVEGPFSSRTSRASRFVSAAPRTSASSIYRRRLRPVCPRSGTMTRSSRPIRCRAEHRVHAKRVPSGALFLTEPLPFPEALGSKDRSHGGL